MEESASEEENETTGGSGKIGMMSTATAEGLKESGAEKRPGSTAASGGATLDVTPEDADVAGAKGRHGAE